MKSVVRFADLLSAKSFADLHPDFVVMSVHANSLSGSEHEHFYICYNKRSTLRPNQATLDYWRREGLI